MLSYTVLPNLCGHVKELNDLIANVQHIVVSVSFSFFFLGYIFLFWRSVM